MFHDHFKTFARYNEWANRHVYRVAAALSDGDYRADRGAFFKSVHGTLNHILVGDGMWMRRFTGEGAAADRLDAILHDDRDTLREARVAEDERIIRYIDTLDETRLAAPFSYRSVMGFEFTQPLQHLLSHFFNHQTHHRGQVHALLSALGEEAPEIDLVYYLRERDTASRA